jgi:hypothetical protein
MVLLGWVIGAPLLGFLADRRKPLLISGLGTVYFGAIIPPCIGGLLFGVGSGVDMIPYALIKEANPDNVKCSATRRDELPRLQPERVPGAGLRACPDAIFRRPAAHTGELPPGRLHLGRSHRSFVHSDPLPA